MAKGLAVVTGGAKGIGRAVTEWLADDGFDVIAVGRDRAALDDVAQHERVNGAVCDVTDEDQVTQFFAGLPELHVLVNNAGTSKSAPLGRTSLDDWRHQMDTNATSAFLCTKAALPVLNQAPWGRVVTVASIASLAASPYMSAYAASKHAALGLTRATAAEVAGTHVTANAVCPSYVRSEMTDRSIARIMEKTGRSADEALQAILKFSPLGRLVEPEEVAAAVGYLCGPHTGAVNGQTIVIDGGAIQS